ncbi:uncharacterized protein LOC124129677 [Haliotis rufescens]|uniref:uncharacterized protein LOC124129677 n=1 Tax=Haliotis rufescens TaxID=6454 RepID=UPI00201F106E|nr:uncharacterized protein LOC124129677 [Haliotis rufescens]
MQSAKVLSLSLACVALYLTAVNGECGTVGNAKITTCVQSFKLTNKALIDAGNATCTAFKDSCTSYKVMTVCVNLLGFPGGCETKYDDKLKTEGIVCTNAELKAMCGGATSLMTRVTLLITFLVTIFNV